MAHIISMTNGDQVDIDTREGCYQYVSRFLIEHGASSLVLSCLSKLRGNPSIDILPQKE